MVEDSLDLETCEGAATIGLELAESGASLDAVLISLGGGALATGIGHVLKEVAPQVEVICVQPRGAPALTYSWHQRRVVTTDTTDSIADGVVGRYPSKPCSMTFSWSPTTRCSSRRDRSSSHMRQLLDHAGLVVEPAAALGVAAILENPDRFAGRRLATIMCGSNVDPSAYRRWIGNPAIRRAR